jgi:S1-C subfamily serine protease
LPCRALGQKVPEVITISELTKESPAKGVLLAGDVVVSVDGRAVTSSDALRAAVRAHKPGESAVFTVRRGGAEKVLPRQDDRGGGTDRGGRLPADHL